MATSSKSEHDSSVVASTSTSLFFSASSEIDTTVVQQIERSKMHWTEVDSDYEEEEEGAEVSNVKVFKDLQMHPTWGTFFRTFGDREDDFGKLVVGKKFAEGGQAELYEAEVVWRDPALCEFTRKYGIRYALKVFKKGTYLKRLRSQWPQGMLDFHAEKVETSEFGTGKYGQRYFCDVVRATLLSDGRFAFLLVREKEDLRRMIDRFKQIWFGYNYTAPFPEAVATRIMYEIAKGMDSLHGRNIIHRDLKAANVLVTWDSKYVVADYESSVGVMGTGYFRAPEILQACEDGNVRMRPELFTKEADVYSYGMTCYEILTGELPFEGLSRTNYTPVLKGARPKLPKYVDDWARELLSKCWHSNPAMRPSFNDILNLFPVFWKKVSPDVCGRLVPHSSSSLPLSDDIMPVFQPYHEISYAQQRQQSGPTFKRSKTNELLNRPV